MGLFGRHTSQAGGNPEALRAIQEAAERGDTAALQAIAAGGRASGIRGINDSYNYGEAAAGPYRQFAQSLLSGDNAAAQAITQRAGATFRPSSRGLLASIAPTVLGTAVGGPGLGLLAAGSSGLLGRGAQNVVRRGAQVVSRAAPVVGLIPGVGTLAAGALGAGGALLGGENIGTALQRGALGAAGGLAGGVLRGAGGVGGVLGGAGRAIGSVGGSVGGALGAAGRAIGGVGGALTGAGGTGGGLGSLLQTGLGVLGTVQGAQREGQANRLREQSLASLAPSAGPNLASTFADPGNPYARPQQGGALQAARASLRGY